MTTINLLKETFIALDNARRRPNEVLWVGTKDWSCSFVEFTRFAKDIEYDPGFGTEQIATDMVIVGEGWWMERSTYDGSEWWRYCILPERKSRNELTSAKQLKSEYAYEGEQV
jgi:hypothetical protein